jgi:hypothetical protein
MKLLLENWRKYLNEGIVTLENWPAEYDIEIEKDPHPQTAYSIRLYRDRKRLVGSLNVDPVNAGSDDSDPPDGCNYEIFDNLYTLHVQVDESVPRGFGPFLTDLALELAYKDKKWIIPARLVGGRGNKAAERIYDFYLDNRKDVEIKEIDLVCWENYVNSLVPDDTPESFLYLYRKEPTIINSELAKKVIEII